MEAGFRFFKDPLFFADAFFLKSARRIMALTMVMGLALLVYALAEEELRRTLKTLKESLPDQKKRPTGRPTMRWIFQLMEGIHWVPSRGGPKGRVAMKELQKKIVSLFLSGSESDLWGVSGKCKIPPKWEIKNPPSQLRRRDGTRGSSGRNKRYSSFRNTFRKGGALGWETDA